MKIIIPLTIKQILKEQNNVWVSINSIHLTGYILLR
jgi:hypothetical protein